jgi:hypothetical protein
MARPAETLRMSPRGSRETPEMNGGDRVRLSSCVIATSLRFL